MHSLNTNNRLSPGNEFVTFITPKLIGVFPESQGTHMWKQFYGQTGTESSDDSHKKNSAKNTDA